MVIGLAVDQNFAAVRLVDAGHDLDQGRFAGAVLAEQRMNLAGFEREGNVVERLRRGEALGDVPHLEDGHPGAVPIMVACCRLHLGPPPSAPAVAPVAQRFAELSIPTQTPQPSPGPRPR